MGRITVTGASGFIGSRAALRLSASGQPVLALGRDPACPPGLKNTGIEYAQTDYTDVLQLRSVFQGSEGVLHCAGKAGAWGSFASYWEANVAVTQRVLAAAAQAGVKRFVNLSSPSISFDYKNQFNLPEIFLPPRFSNAYAETKYLAEVAVRAAHSASFQTLSLRPRGVIGEGDTNWFPRIIEMRQAGKLKQVGSGKNLVNFTSISNLLDAIELAFKAPAFSESEVFNIHNGVDESFWEVVELGLKKVGLDGHRRRVPLAPALALARLNEKWNAWRGVAKEPALLPVKIGVAAYSLTMDLSKARRLLGYVPRQTTEQALEEFAAWYGKRGLPEKKGSGTPPRPVSSGSTRERECSLKNTIGGP